MKSMIPPKDNHGIFSQFKALQFVQQPPGKSIDVADTGVVSMAQLGDLLLRERSIIGNVSVSLQFLPTPHSQFGRTVGVCIAHGRRDIIPFVVVPVFFRRAKRQVRLAESYGKKEGLTAGFQAAQSRQCIAADDPIDVVTVRNVR